MFNSKELPLVSIIMPTYNTPEKYLKKSINSILRQSYKKFELIIIDDGSTDISSTNLLNSISDFRIRIIKNRENRGLVFSLNRGIKESQGKYIARMDSDDISKKNRLKVQVRQLEKDPALDIIGTSIKKFGIENKKYTYPQNNDAIRSEMFFRNPIAHPTVMFRKKTFDRYKLLYPKGYNSEDYALWSLCAEHHDIKFTNIRKAYLKYRTHEKQITSQKKDLLQRSAKEIIEGLFSHINFNISDKEKNLYFKFIFGQKLLSEEELRAVSTLLLKISNIIEKGDYCSRISFLTQSAQKYRKECLRQYIFYNNHHGKVYLDSELKQYNNEIFFYKFFIKFLDLLN